MFKKVQQVIGVSNEKFGTTGSDLSQNHLLELMEKEMMDYQKNMPNDSAQAFQILVDKCGYNDIFK